MKGRREEKGREKREWKRNKDKGREGRTGQEGGKERKVIGRESKGEEEKRKVREREER